MAPKQTLLGLPVVVLRLIFDLLAKRDIDEFRLVSRACRYSSEPVAFRTVTLHDETRFAEDINEHICDRLRNPKDTLSQHVRHLKIGTFKQEKHCPSETTLVDVLRACNNLLDFSWNVLAQVPKGVLETLSTHRPETRLHVTNHLRRGPYIPLDIALLSSQNLHSLDLTVCGKWISPRPRIFEYRSEFPALKSALLQARNLKILRLYVDSTTIPDQQHWVSQSNPNFDFEDGDVFPNLEELDLPYDHYVLSADHCAKWVRAMDWSYLRRLVLHQGAPKHLFSALTGKIPKLKALRFGFWPNHSSDRTWECLDVSIVSRFLESINGLEELDVANMDMTKFQEIEEDVFKKHGRSLKRLHVSFNAAMVKGWVVEDVRRLTEHCLELQDLSFRIAMEMDTTVPYRRTIWPAAAIDQLKNLTHLRNLSLEFLLDEFSTEFIGFSNGYSFLVDKAAKDRVISLFKSWEEASPGYGLEECTVRYQITPPFTEWTFTVRSGREVGSDVDIQKEVTGGGVVEPVGMHFDPWG